ncbi:glycosyltransferase [Pseudoalteromonas sp. CST5]|uniref:glycosyltransferase n=2 Tax=Pseudoalteromonas TaxID=53246 RepID=UPI00235A0955|nr:MULTISPECIES: glycosyltransferase [unclassified Pseudoalteromonas]MDC9514548.1 glycosyltransferase [Pseudoalteromonas sp. CST1]MDC9539007.1 glycosyltransferase [Pseudoalteromonas sp. CST3]MDC9541813.1 glycosyltransferase [Pseudoalteromonas sp. CST2]MDC9546524.1 glycosyltransferase [Pseudoalteromonas sp. CST4]MDC9550720.1 glycosyltransferase [Pseudoalteromonas sp. CST5]
MNKKVLVIASAGGHLTQAMCATSQCDEIVLVSNKVNIKKDNISKIYKIIDTQKNIFIHIFNVFFALYVLLKERPAAVFSTGGPIALPFALVCKVSSLKFIYLDTLSRVVELSNTGKLIKKYHLYDEFYSQWKNVASKSNTKYIGKCFDILSENNYKPVTEAVEGRPIILVTVGTSQYDFDRLFEMLYKQPLYNNDQVRWVIQAGHNKLKHSPAKGKVVDMITRSEMEQLVKSASLVISHCGIGSINQMLAYQKKVLFVPRVSKFNEFSDDHQLQIANEISNKIFTVLMPEQDMPTIKLNELLDRKIVTSPVDTTNYKMANELKNVLFELKS